VLKDFPLDELVLVVSFGEPIYPVLTPIDRVQRGGPNKPWHILINADNYHALQLLLYSHERRIDLIYIDPPYNTGARDWKYNNDYVDTSDVWRHSKWLSMMKKRLRLAKRLLRPDGVLICAVDDYEVHHLISLLEEVFAGFVIETLVVVPTRRVPAAKISPAFMNMPCSACRLERPCSASLWSKMKTNGACNGQEATSEIFDAVDRTSFMRCTSIRAQTKWSALVHAWDARMHIRRHPPLKDCCGCTQSIKNETSAYGATSERRCRD
jgi:hypothetical protein